MRSPKMQIWREFEVEKQVAAEWLFDCRTEHWFEMLTDFDLGAVPAAGRSAGPEDNLELGVGFGSWG